MADESLTSGSQIEQNYAAFIARLPELAATHAGKLAVMRNGEIVDFFDTYADAVRFGQDKFGQIGNFSVQEVTNRAVALGFYSYAAGHVQ